MVGPSINSQLDSCFDGSLNGNRTIAIQGFIEKGGLHGMFVIPTYCKQKIRVDTSESRPDETVRSFLSDIAKRRGVRMNWTSYSGVFWG